MNANTKQKGFSIIEVVLVLAIAALIFLMVFIALPALQRGQRDTARKQDANQVATALNTWRGNHRGQLPASDKYVEFETKYVKQLGQYDVSGEGEENASGTLIWRTDGETPTLPEGSEGLNYIGIALEAKCNEDGSTVDRGSSRSAAIIIKLEASDAIICTDA